MKKNLVAKELERIASENGGILQPRAVVNAARPVKSPLHNRFEWDNSAAAEAYRLWQARQLISVNIQMIATPTGNINERIWVSLKRDRVTSGYRTIIGVLSDAELREELLAEALEELEYFQTKYGRLSELSEIFRIAKKVSVQHRPRKSTERPRA